MRVTGAGDIYQKVGDTLEGKLPQSVISKKAAAGYSSYGNQIGLATTHVREVYHDGYVAKRLEVGAVVGAAAMAEGLVARMKRELGREDATVIATGGLAGIVADSTDAFDVVDGQLTIKGICEIYRRMQELG